MSWAGIANNQAITFNNLQDAVTTGVLTLKNTIPASNECITKADADYYVYLNGSNSGFAAKSSNQLVYKQDVTSYTAGITFIPSSGLYPVSGSSSSCSGTLTNGNTSGIWVKGIFNSGGANSGSLTNDNIYFNFPVDNPSVPTYRLYFFNLNVTNYGQTIYTNRNSDAIYPGYFSLPAGWSANITIDKFDGIGSGSTLRLAYSLTPSGIYITL